MHDKRIDAMLSYFKFEGIKNEGVRIYPFSATCFVNRETVQVYEIIAEKNLVLKITHPQHFSDITVGKLLFPKSAQPDLIELVITNQLDLPIFSVLPEDTPIKLILLLDRGEFLDTIKNNIINQLTSFQIVELFISDLNLSILNQLTKLSHLKELHVESSEVDKATISQLINKPKVTFHF